MISIKNGISLKSTVYLCKKPVDPKKDRHVVVPGRNHFYNNIYCPNSRFDNFSYFCLVYNKYQPIPTFILDALIKDMRMNRVRYKKGEGKCYQQFIFKGMLDNRLLKLS